MKPSTSPTRTEPELPRSPECSPPEPAPRDERRSLRARLRDVTAAVGAAHREGVPF